MDSVASAGRYRTPRLLEDIRLLDLWEITGSSLDASSLAGVSQPTVSRRTRQVLDDLHSKPVHQRKGAQLRLGDGACLRLLRRAAKRHRLEAGVARFGTDGWLGGLLDGCPQLLPAPPRFRSLAQWHQLVRSHVIDGALVCGQELRLLHRDLPSLDAVGAANCPWEGCVLIPLGSVPLLPMKAANQAPHTTRAPQWKGVLMPPKACCTAITAHLRQLDQRVLHLRSGYDNPAIWSQSLAGNPVEALASPGWRHQLEATGLKLEPMPMAAAINAEVWLMVHRRDWDKEPALAAMTTTLKQHLGRASLQ